MLALAYRRLVLKDVYITGLKLALTLQPGDPVLWKAIPDRLEKWVYDQPWLDSPLSGISIESVRLDKTELRITNRADGSLYRIQDLQFRRLGRINHRFEMQFGFKTQVCLCCLFCFPLRQ